MFLMSMMKNVVDVCEKVPFVKFSLNKNVTAVLETQALEKPY